MSKVGLKPVAIAVSIALISACGSGGGGDDGPTSSSVSGIASKGIIRDGVVKAYKIENGQVDTTAIAEGTTDNTGAYSLAITGYNGPLHIVVSAGPSSTMKCDAANGCSGGYGFGDTMPMPSTMEMAAVIPTVSAGSVKGHITPLTNMAATLAQNTFLDSTNIATAIAKVEEIFDVTDLLATTPVDVTDSAAVAAAEASGDGDSLKVGFISAAIAELAETDGAGDVDATLDTLANNFASNNGELTYNNADDGDGGAGDAGTITLGEITTLTLAAVAKYETDSGDDLADTLVEAEVTALDTTANDPTNTGSNTVTTIAVDDTALADAISAAKGAVTTLRTWSTQLTKLEEAGTLFDTEITAAKTVSTMAMDTVGVGLEYASIAAADAYWATTQSTGLNTNLAGKTYTFSDGYALTFSCSGEFTDNNMDGGEYMALDSTAYIDGYDGNTNVTFPSTSPAIGNSVNYTSVYFDDQAQADVTEQGSGTIADIQTDETCDLTPSTSLADYVGGIDEPWMSATGTVEVTGNSVAVNGVVTDDGSISGNPSSSTVAMNYTLPALSGANFTISMDGTVTNTDKATLTIAAGSTANIVFASSVILGDEVTITPAVNSIDFNLDATMAQGTLADDGTTVTDPVSFNGQLAVAGVRSSGTTADTTEGNPSQLNISGTFSTQSGKSFAADFSATMANASSFMATDLIGTIKANLGSYAFSDSNNTLTMTFPESSVVYTYDANSNMITSTWYDDQGNTDGVYSWSAGTYWDGMNDVPYTSLTEYLTDHAQHMSSYAWVDGEGEYMVTMPASLNLAGGTFSGTLVEQDMSGETSSNWRQLAANLSFEANGLVWVDPLDANNTETLPDATITLDLDRTGFMALTADVLISYGDIDISVQASGNGDTDTVTGTVVVTDTSVPTSPVNLTITPDFDSHSPRGSISVGSSVVGSLREDASLGLLIINYVDGSFESVVL